MEEKTGNFIWQFVEEDLSEGQRCYGMQVHTRFPPEPNGYLHIGHCKALTIDFGTAERFGGICNLRMDDTNPAKEDTEYVEAIQEDIHWLGFDWGDRFYYGSDYFEKTYEYAVELIKKGLAYVCELTPEQFKEYRGDIGKPAISPWRDRPVEENLDLFERMKNGEFKEGQYTLRAKIDLASGNFNMRDPVLYRIRYIEHHRQGTKWCIFPMYDFAHPIQDALEGITHSLCSLEYEAHRPLYNWVVDNVSIPYIKPRQIEFARLGINYTVMSKRKLRKMVEENVVDGWDDPRMPTLCGLRRRGYTSGSIRTFCEKIGVSKVDSTVDIALLESCLRDDLNQKAKRVMAVLEPVKLTITNYPDGQSELLDIENNPVDENAGTRKVSFSKHLWVEKEDFMEVPANKYKRLYPGNEVRLKGANLVTSTGGIKYVDGNVTEILCEYDTLSRGGNPADGRKVKGATIHWTDMETAVDAEVRIYDRLFTDPDPDGPDKDFLDYINKDSLKILSTCKVEKCLSEIPMPEKGKDSESFQFMRQGYFCLDNKFSAPGHLIFNRSVALKDSFRK
ncbi:MAG: glutamine--tRNA ligase/YqeY domain fusion protein [Oscillospiraceae bacterium]|nr:glutamine--tRNA ligase/YqeY domain fusion protein [Oscillospiraceae bacterium]